MKSLPDNCEPIYSPLASDPDLSGIVDLFVAELPGRVASLLDQLEAHDWEGLVRTAHQLKGAAGSYGFHPISPAAGRVEQAVRQLEPEPSIREAVENLVALCRSVRSGPPPKQDA